MRLPFKLQSKERKQAERIETVEYIDSIRSQFNEKAPIQETINNALKQVDTDNPRAVIKKLENYVFEYVGYWETVSSNGGWGCFTYPPIDPFNPNYKLNILDGIEVFGKTMGVVALWLALGYGAIKGLSCVSGSSEKSEPKTNYSIQENLEGRVGE